MRRLALIGVPSSAGARQTGQEGGPSALRGAGLLGHLWARDLDVVDLGDLRPVTYSPDPEHSRHQNLGSVIEVAEQVAHRVDRALADHRLPLVLGGDCSLSLGVIAGLLRHHPRLGLMYFDADIDLNTPETTSSGVFDGMVLAHALGLGEPDLAGIGPRRPLLSEQDIALFGYDADSGWIDPPEVELLKSSKMSKYPLSRVRADPPAAAKEALVGLESRSDAILVHFDVDVTDIPAADVHHPGGLDLDSALSALRIFVAARTCAALVVTEFNPLRDPDGSQAERLVEGLVEALTGETASPGS
ncbi:MAG: arginase family protein [Thermoanaerobaculia bacterium]